MREGGHGFCRQRLSGSLWLPCWACNASRHDATGADCGACFGVGFIESELCWNLVGGGYTPTGEGSA
jgi:hypothetical protein